jgi:hypothetical protein
MSFITLQDPASSEVLGWPQLGALRLGSQAAAERAKGVGGSDANVIFSGEGERIRELWLEKRGEATSSDLSDVLPVMLGCWTEEFNRQWFERVTARSVSRVGEALQCRRHEWRRCTLDGFVEAVPAVFEAKHTNAFANAEEVTTRYMPQLQHNMAVAGVDRAFLSVIFGNHKYELIEVAADWLYQLELLEAEDKFWDCVVTGKEPVPQAPPAPPRPIGTREVCLEGNNAWAAAAADWLDNREAAKAHQSATKALKELVEEDVGRAFGHGIEAKRSRSGAITLRELKA